MARKKVTPASTSKSKPSPKFDAFQHPEATSAMRPDVGTQAAFRKKKPPATYRYDSSFAPALDWDGQNPAREQGEAILADLARQLAEIRAALDDPSNELKPALRDTLAEAAAECVNLIDRLKAMSRPFLNWAGKAERLSFEVPTLPLFVHERLSTRAIIETLSGHRRQKEIQLDLFGDPRRPIADHILRAYEYQDQWVNRMILGDSLVVMNSLLHYEGLGGQVQMIYIDPPYGIQFGSNFQPFVRRRDVSHGDDDDMTREPETVQAYRDTWQFGLHSYLSYLKDRLLLSRELLHPTGSVFLQISDDHLHHLREVMDEVFGSENLVCTIIVSKTSSATGNYLSSTTDYLLWYSKDIGQVKFHQPYSEKSREGGGAENYDRVELPDGTRRAMTAAEKRDPSLLPTNCKIYRMSSLCSQSIGREKGEGAACWFPVDFQGKQYHPT
jgi:adenine-specific DNA-methyltransferase